jgi:hypothetical protein
VPRQNWVITPDFPSGQPPYGRLELIVSQKEIVVMNPIRHIRRSVGVVVGLAATLLVALGATPAFATLPVPGGNFGSAAGVPAAGVPAQVQVRTIVAGGMPGWQIALIAVGAALLAAAVAVFADRALAARRQTAVAAA